MSTPLQEQLLDYFSYVDEQQGAVDFAALREAVPIVGTAAHETKPEQSFEAHRRRRWPIALIGAAAAVLLMTVGFLSQPDRGEQENILTADAAERREPTPTPQEPTVESDQPDEIELIGPGLWSVAATLLDASPDQLVAVAEQVRLWSGVVEAQTAVDATAWRRLTGFDAGSCLREDTEPPCEPGLVLLVADGQGEAVARRLESELGMTAIAAHEEPWDFFRAYLAEAVDLASPAPVRFDPASLGSEIAMTGPFVDSTAAAGCPASICELGVDVDVDGGPVRVSLAVLSPDRFETETDFGSPTVMLGLGGAIAFMDVADLLPGRHGAAGVSGSFDLSAGGGRRWFVVFGLPLDVAVVTVELGDGSTVWQRPLAGMAVLFDGLDSFFPETSRTTMTALDAEGNTLLLIEGGARQRELIVTDLRVEVDRPAQSEPAPGSPVAVAGEGLTVTWTEVDGSELDLPYPLVATPSGILGRSAGRAFRWTDGARWEQVTDLEDVVVESLVDGRDFVLVSGTGRADGQPVLMKSLDGRTWSVIDRSSLEGVGTEVVATSPSGLTVISPGHAFLVEGDRVTGLHDTPWNATCCNPIDLIEFDGATVALVRDFNEPRVSSAWRYIGDEEWAQSVSVPISSRVAMINDTVLMFDRTGLGCCRPPVGANSQAALLTSTNGTEWTTHATLDDATTNGLQIEAGDFFWVYGLHGFGGADIERYDEFATLWISTDAASWAPLDVSFAPNHSIVTVVGDTIFISGATQETSQQGWIGQVEID